MSNRIGVHGLQHDVGLTGQRHNEAMPASGRQAASEVRRLDHHRHGRCARARNPGTRERLPGQQTLSLGAIIHMQSVGRAWPGRVRSDQRSSDECENLLAMNAAPDRDHAAPLSKAVSQCLGMLNAPGEHDRRVQRHCRRFQPPRPASRPRRPAGPSARAARPWSAERIPARPRGCRR